MNLQGENQLQTPLPGSDDASGYVGEPCVAPAVEGYSEIRILSRSERNVVASATRHGRRWVLKGLAPGADDATGRAALRKEFDIMMSLPRMGCVSAYALEEVSPLGVCIVMEYVEGATLDVWLAHPHTRRERRRMARRLIEAVGAMHASGIVHRDIKPTNIIVSDTGSYPVLVDFGLADTCAHTELKIGGGTPRYMAPEQYTPSDRPDPRNDLYSLGVVLGQMKLGLAWRGAVKRCLRPIDRRPDSAHRVLSLSRNAARRMVWLPILAVSAAGALLLASVIDGRQGRPDDSTLAAQLATQHATQQALVAATERVDSLDQVIASVRDSLVGERLRREHRREYIDRLIAEECRRLDAIWQRTAMYYLDTVNVNGFVANAVTTSKLDDEAARFLNAADGQLTPEEKMQVREALNDNIKANYQKWATKRERMNLDY